MRNVPLMSLADIAESVRYGYTASASESEVGPKFLRITDIVPPQIDWVNVPYCKIDEKNLMKYSLEPGDIVIARTGATVGYAKLIRDNQPSVFASYLVRIRVDPEKANPLYVGRIVESEFYKRFVLSRVGGAAQPNANAKVLSSFRLPIPVKATQHRIASILSAYDDLIENNRRRIQLLEQAARLLYKEWFVHLRFPGHEHVTITDGVPEGWEKKHLSELLNTQYGFTETAIDEPVGPKFLRGTDINKTSYIDWSSVPYCSDDKLDFSKYALHVDDIVVIRMADPGKVAIVESEIKAVFASYLVRLTRKEGVSIPALYLFYVLSGDLYQGFISGASGGSTRKSASAKLLVDFNALIPPASLMYLFVEQVQPLRSQIHTLLVQNSRLREACDLFLPRLMNGEVVV
jgi:type I restriction enzyme S subunit